MLGRFMFTGLLVAGLCACEKQGDNVISKEEIAQAMDRLAFTCVKEADQLPALNRDADLLYQYGLYLEKQKGQKPYDEIARFYRIAAAYDHYKAATNLQALLSTGQASSPSASRETINLVEHFIAKNIPGAYYDMAHYLELGYGVKQDTPASRAYFRRAADLGNPDAQYYVAELLLKLPKTADIVREMYKCAMEQGHKTAAYNYGVFSEVREDYSEAVKAYQLATRNGDNDASFSLKHAFEGPPPSDDLYYLGLEKDIERSLRYEKINDFLTRHEHLGAKVPDLDDIVPLPPAPLPAWDGTFKWKRDRDAAAPLSPPPDELVQRMSAEKGLDPKTGLPLLPPKSAQITRPGTPYAVRGRENRNGLRNLSVAWNLARSATAEVPKAYWPHAS
jgi:TPR repeat protein